MRVERIQSVIKDLKHRSSTFGCYPLLSPESCDEVGKIG